MNKILVLGGTGFLGHYLCKSLSEQGYVVRIFDRKISKLDKEQQENFEFFEGDFLNQHDIEQALDGCDNVFHLISTTVPKSSNDNMIYDVESNLIGSLNVLNAAVRHNIKKVIFPSSGGTVYGVPVKIPISEAHSTNPICSYGINKLAIEKYLHVYAMLHGLDYSIVRISNPYGNQHKTKLLQGAVDIFIAKALARQPVEIWGDGSVVRDYIHIFDVIQALIKSLSYTGKNKIFNISSGEGKSLNETLDVLEDILGYSITRTYQNARKADVPVSILDNTLAQKELNWIPKITFADGLKQTVHDFSK